MSSSSAAAESGNFKLYTDGGQRGSGLTGAGAILYRPNGSVSGKAHRFLEKKDPSDPLEKLTSNVAEYEGLLLGLEMAAKKTRTVSVYMDSKLVVNQVRGAWSVKSHHLRPYRDRAREAIKSFKYCVLHWIPRAQNKEADALANQAMDTRKSKLEYF